MEANMTSKDRLNAFRSSLGISIHAFEVKCSLSNGYMNGKTTMPSTPILQNVHAVYPDLNMNWVLFGEGNMLLSDSNAVNTELDSIKQNTQSSTTNDEVITNLLAMLKSKDAANEDLLRNYMAKVAECDSLRIQIQKMQEGNTHHSHIA